MKTDEKKMLMYFGNKVREARIKKKMSQFQLGKISGIDRDHIGRIERGKTNISLKTAFELADSLKIHISKFFQK